ncbi:MAG TPA: TonB-dependent receptor [Niabella sp.]|nr:TonB-dependent receptor [Niabella sp.]
MLNLAMDFRLKKDMLSGNVEVFYKKGSDLYGTVPIDYTAGLGTEMVTKNIAKMTARGIDISLNSTNINKKFVWTTTLNLNFYKDEVDNYFLAATQGSFYVTTGGLLKIVPVKGKPVYSMLSYRWGGLDPETGDPQGYLNGEISKDYMSITSTGITKEELVYSGPLMPVLNVSLGNTLRYNAISLAVRVTGKSGYYFRRSTINYSSLYANYAGHTDFAYRWQQKGDEAFTNIPSMSYPANASKDAFYAGTEPLTEKGDHIRLQYITLSYSIRDNVLSKLSMQYLQVYFNASNLGIIWRNNKHHIDPDFADNSIIPSKTFALGIRCGF